MYEDFNPLDISAPKKPIENKDKLAPVKVTKVGHGALLHSKFTKLIVTIMLIGLLGIGSYASTFYYLGLHPEINPLVKNKSATPSTNTPAVQSSDTAKSKEVDCNGYKMPDGVCSLTAAIEKDGIKSNKQVIYDTVDVEDGSKVDGIEQTWKSLNDTTGTMVFNFTDSKHKYAGTATFIYKDNTWKITNIEF